MEKYYTFTETWALSSLAGNEKFDAIPERLQNAVPSTAEIESQDQNDEEADTPEPTIPDHHDPQQMTDDQSTDDEDSYVNEEASDEVSTETPPAEPSLKVIKKKVKKDKLTKNSVMPTWSGTQHLLGKHRGETPVVKTNSEPLAPFFRNSPKDWATLYTVLSYTQDVNAVVLGGTEKTIITLDMDLSKLALQLKALVKNKNWKLIPVHLHMFFADEHALGKVIGGSGLDTVAIESGIYSASTIRSICDGKKYTRGKEYHIMNALAIFSLKLEAVFGPEFLEDLRQQTKSFRESLHEDSPDMVEIYEDIANHYTENIKPNLPECKEGLPKFVNNYLRQVETFLASVSSIHHRDFESCLTLIDRKIKYYSGTDLPWYFKLMTVHLGQMNELKHSDPATWNRLKQDFVVTKSTLAFCNLFVDQGLEQEIKELKRYWYPPGITQDEEAMYRFVATSPHLAKYVEMFLRGFPKHKTSETPVYHQLKGNMALQCTLNSIRIRDIIVAYCQGNPILQKSKLKNITSGVLIPDKPADDILFYPEKGQAHFENLIQTRLLPGATQSIWDPLPQLNLKRFSTWMKAKTVKVGDTVIKLREDRKLLNKIIIIAKARPDLITKMEDIVGNYEMSVIPRANFSPDGSMVITADKSSLMKLIIEQTPLQVQTPLPGNRPQVLIIDAMPEAKPLKKKATTTKLSHLRDIFIQRINRKIEKGNYSEVYIAFDEWRDESLKDKTWAKRAANQPGNV